MIKRRQLEVWEVILQWYHQHGYSPTLKEIGQTLGIKTRSTVHQHIQILIKEGYLLATTGKSAYQLRKQDTEQHPQMSLPLAGQIAAGRPIEAVIDQNEISPNELFIGPGRYALKVRGESMIDIGVMDDDYVVIQPAEDARNGEIVVALINQEEVTLKRIFHLLDGQVELRPENSSMQPMLYPAESVQVQGRMVGLFRSYN